MNKQPIKLHPICRYLFQAIIGLGLGLNIYSLNATRLARNQVPMPFGVGVSVVLSGSMEPTLSVGDLLIIHEAESYAEGEVVVFQSGGMAIVHRIISMDGDTVVTQGDANNAADAPIPVEAISGRVTAVLPLVGYVVWAMESPVGVLVTLGAAALLMELSYRNTKREKELEQERVKEEIRRLMQEMQD